ncbi:MAG: DNA gyrase subunit A [Stygiobacter sp. RIFOXYC12_FULL_38_8]|nr:MAG: DNA gyrase subunit A [Stygiobacter sp. GWC2_38_9]OGU84771.1 MAG: DNA gyrase subunit A [Stygiobacter sp. RIFOXYA12_FULL_38_9]OGV07707.1 MAG: DNA gyrase subunit A [Stygiobacter sp. RIFOXYB2_FULL_37_11]OGV12710.1 MAG: DNA gyrase subunit A [Stygiobacter sp. RIFOXYC2_FULL_38_25]OGV17637.1 MAG: DNA gyrase subunit A [Stygiobacter sp. RIFOXYA2_FULL_38_8]OGV26968.1 MAG: DNA gyrase subunit A [Stygiobacter sp. RIFOXYC12_FULL_38_8]OGV82033.1 MAG: DNA gyrase subunit A [Stygiobacter sp. GWF2_38_21]
MTTIFEKVVPVSLEEEMKSSYIDYAMSVIVARALPDVRDGLKPVHRRVLYGMHELSVQHNKPYKKSARIVGEVLGKYHPHGDTAVYDSMVRMAQEWSLRYPLVDGQGNFGSVDGDSPAAMRYTEARLARIAEEMLRDLDKNTVDFGPNFDDSLQEPLVMPSYLPNLLVNGASGIAVGMATNIPPHNLREIIDGLILLIDNPKTKPEEILKIVKAPDFPTGGIIYGYEGVKDAFLTGRGRVVIRAKANVEVLKNDRENIVITELPYQVNKATLIEKIAELVREGKIEGISNLRDESDRDGMRVVIELKRDGQPAVILNNLFKHTSMQVTFGVIMLALVHGAPKVLTLQQMMEHFLDHRMDVLVRRTKFELDAAERRAHILEGYIIALDNIDEVIQTIKKSRDVETAKQALMRKFKLSEIQSKAILDMRLQRLTGLERKKIEDEYKEVIKFINKLKAILGNEKLRRQIIKEELLAIKERYGDERRTEIIHDYKEFSLEDTIAEEDVVVTISHAGFIKRFPVSGYRKQGRGGKGVTGAGTREEDFIEHMFVASTHHYIMFFTDRGKCYWLKVHEIPEGGRATKGRSILNLIEKDKEENITAFVTVKEFVDDKSIVMVTKQGTVKKTVLSAYSNIRRGGILAINLAAGDSLVEAKLSDGNNDIIIGTSEGMAIHFKESDVRDMGRTATGVRGINLGKKDYVIGMIVVRNATTLMVVTDKGFGKRSEIEDYRLTKRGGKGVITVKTSDRNGKMIAMKEVNDGDELVIITTGGMVLRQAVSELRVMGRNTQGVRLIRLNEGDEIADIARVIPEDEEE